ncbi:TetR/AcrR family transcriptional regulator [Nocardia sp. NPDC058176]|uniref:TetR/AcrR family transcriptional regulator n=1 Tax=Nocardia sp. NPDC058176 TaxID=3346368 RepID=UPI0036D937D4
MPESTSPAEPSRRELKRQQTVEEIKTRARRQLVEDGPGGLSLRAVARDMRMSSAAIYRYFANQPELVGALCVDAYNALADSLEAARDAHAADGPTRQWWAIGQAIRDWSLRSGADFALIFGTPVTGYHAPESVTGPAAARSILIALGTYSAALDSGAADLDRCILPEKIEGGELGTYLLAAAHLDPTDEAATTRLAGMAAAALNAWASILGFLISEQFGNLPRLIANTDDLYAAHLRTIMIGLGFPPEAVAQL